MEKVHKSPIETQGFSIRDGVAVGAPSLRRSSSGSVLFNKQLMVQLGLEMLNNSAEQRAK
jgi:hypothetical protein